MEDIYKIKECIVHNCVNNNIQGEFAGDLCWPCHKFIIGEQAHYSQAYRNAIQVIPKGFKLVPEEVISDWIPTSKIRYESRQEKREQTGEFIGAPPTYYYCCVLHLQQEWKSAQGDTEWRDVPNVPEKI